MDHTPLVSVVINAYNVEAYLAECLDSVMAQTLQDFEIILVDDGSTDATGRIAETYAARDTRIRLLRNERNRGIPAAINRALAVSHGEFVAKLDADDAALPERFEKQVAYLHANPLVVAVGCWWERIDHEGRPLGTQRPWPSNRRLARQMRTRCVLTHTGTTFRGDLLRRLGYREFFLYAHDYDLFLRLIDHGEVAILPEVLVKQRLNFEGVTVQRFAEQSREAHYARLFARQRRRRGSDDYTRVAADPNVIRRGASSRGSRCFYYYRRGLLRVTLGDMRVARAEFAKSLRATPWDVRVAAWFALTLVPRPFVEVLRRVMWRLRWGRRPE
ncbi:MAG: glycosyltransferase [Verrucomicrobia bacterium]|nr:glycosyltransferase [Verrucomicrobiota bacterium]